MAEADRAVQAEWVHRVLGIDPAGSSGGSGGGGGVKAALDRWTASRSEVVGQLRKLESAIKGMQHPSGDRAIILVRAIIANLTPAPDSKRSVAELRRYIETDDIIDDAESQNGFGIDIRIREPLLPVLEALDRSIAA